jgi:hypothetical protein
LKYVLGEVIEMVPDDETTHQFLTNLALQIFEQFFRAPNEPRLVFTGSRILEGLLQNLLTIVQKRPAVGRYLRHLKEKLIEDCLFFYNVREKLDAV